LNIKVKNTDVAGIFIDKLNVRIETIKGASIDFFLENPELFDENFKSIS
jgi:hypothetical protein